MGTCLDCGRTSTSFLQTRTCEHDWRKKHLWGNIPAFDVLQLGSNEGDGYGGPLRLLFACTYSLGLIIFCFQADGNTNVIASGDLRNVVKTIVQIPTSYNQAVEATINDHELAVVARNAIFLLVALVVENMDEAVDCIIHLWCSNLIRRSDLNTLQEQIRPLIENVCEKIKNKATDTLHAQTWTFGQRSLRLVLEKSSWESILSFMNIREGLTAKQASQIRTDTVLAESLKDHWDRQLTCQPPFRRIAIRRFWEDGLMLPFGSPRYDFQEPNP